MRKFLSFLLMTVASVTVFAQSYPTNGYYRVQNRGNGKRYVSLIDNRGTIDYKSLNNSDLNASRLRPFVANDKEPGVVNDPGSVFFATQKGTGAYDLAAQGSSVSSLVSGVYLNLKSGTGNADFPWFAYGVQSGVTVYICGASGKGPNGTLYKLGVGNSASGSTFHWAISPVTTTGDNYFGLIPDVTAGGAYYKEFYAAFPFKTTGNMKAYYVKKVDKTRGLVVYEEISSAVPTSTPCFVKCNGAEATDNRLDLQMTSPPALSGNLLKGVYFSYYDDDGDQYDHNNYKAFNANTMRVLGVCSDGKLGYVAPSGLQRIAANSSYLEVGSGAPAEMKLVTQEEYDKEGQAVTLTAKSYTRQYGEDNPTFEYTASGTVNGTPVITCAATKTSPVGTYPIVITAGTVQGAVTTVNGTLTITKAPLTITAKSYTITQTDPLPTFEATYSGFKNGETNSVLTTQPTLTSNVPSDKKPGTYDITPAGAAATNYDISYVKGTLTITQAATITIKAKNATMVYGDDVPQLQYEVTGGTLTGTPKLVCSATKTSDVGTYTITVDVSGINYPNLKTENGTLTINKAPVAVTAKSYTIAQTDALPTFEATYSGWKNGQNQSVLTKQPTFSCNAPSNKTPGEYTITVSGAEAKNYSFTYTNGKLTITQAAAITITAKNATMVYGDDVPQLQYEVTGGTLTGTPKLVCSATKTSDVGTYTITVDVSGINYPNLKTVNGTLTINKAPVAVTAKSYTIVETDALPTFEATYSGWKNGQNQSVLTKQPTFSCNAPSNKTPGEYTITVSGAEAKNYSFTYTNGKLTITQAAAITITAKNATMVYGDDVPQLQYEVTGGTLTGTPKLVCSATKTSDVGTYTITVDVSGINYPNLKTVNGTLTINKAPVAVTAKSYTIAQTDALPTFEATYSGWKNGQNQSVLTKQPTFSCNAPSNKTPGEYTITVSGAEAKNYSFTYTNGKLTITQAAAITITAKNATMVYGDDVPQLQYEVTGGTLTGTPKLVCSATKTSDVGTYAITVDVSGINYPNLKTVNGTLTINKAPVAVTAKSYTIVETDALPTFEATYSGWKNGQNQSVLTKQPTFNCNAPSNKTPGEYTITVSGAEAKNYSFTYTNGKLTITQAPTITVKAVAKTMTYGDDVPELTYTVEGGTLTGTPVLNTTASKTSDVGEYDITIAKGTINYPRLVLQGAKLTITKAAVTVKAKSYTIVETDALPTFEAEYSGWKNSQNESVLTKKAILSCDAPSNKTPGEYTITVSGAEAKNYSFTYTNGKLTITQAPTITVKAVAKSMTYGNDVPELTYTVEGGTLTGTPVLNTTASKTSDVGEYDITVAKGTINYPRLVLQGAKLTVNKATVTVNAGTYTMKQNEQRPTFKATYSGWKNGDTEAVLTKQPTLTTNAPANNAPGEYTVTASGAEAKNYDFTYKEGKLVITAADAITIMATNATMVYGGQVPELKYTITGGTVTGTPKLTCEAKSTSDVGEYVIKVEKGTVDYPNIVLVDGKLTINQAPVAVTAKSYTIVETDALPTFEAEYSGWKNGQNESVLTKKAILSCDAPSNKTPGEYTITVSGAEAKNYSFTYTNGKLTITQAPTITVKAVAKTMTYGDAVPELTYTVEGGTLTGTPVLNTTASKTSDVGDYDITIAKGTIDYPRLVLQGAKLTVNKATVTVNAGSYTMKQNEQRPTFKATYSGWKNGQDESVLTKQPTFATTAPANNAPGEYEVTVSGAEAKNYAFTYVPGKLVITAADAITIMAIDTTMVYGEQVPELKYTVTGGSVTGTPVLTCEAKSTSDVGEYVIKVEKGTIDYPNIVLVNGKLTITKAELTVTASDAVREEGEPNPEFTLTYSGWKNGDTESVLIKKPVATTEADETSEPGEYVITVSGGEAKNYTFKYVNGKLTVNKDDAIVDLIAQGKAFDIYTLGGVKVRSNVTTLKGLPRGIYMINGKKIMVK